MVGLRKHTRAKRFHGQKYFLTSKNLDQVGKYCES